MSTSTSAHSYSMDGVGHQSSLSSEFSRTASSLAYARDDVPSLLGTSPRGELIIEIGHVSAHSRVCTYSAQVVVLIFNLYSTSTTDAWPSFAAILNAQSSRACTSAPKRHSTSTTEAGLHLPHTIMQSHRLRVHRPCGTPMMVSSSFE